MPSVQTAEFTITLELLRYDPDKDQAPSFKSYKIPYVHDWVVLDAINYIKDEIDGTISHRWSCRMGVCGSCGMMVNGVPKLACSAFLRDYYPSPIRVEPLTHFPVERDLIVQMDGFMSKLQSVKPYLIRKDPPAPLEKGEFLQTPVQRARYAQFSMCINCMLCYAACPVVGMEEEFVGPAALALAHRYNMDSRDQGQDDRADVVASEHGVWSCTFVGECSEVCPKHVDPAGAIQQAKVEATKDWWKRALMPWTRK